MSEEKAVYDVQQAQAVLEQERQARTERVAQRIREILDAEKCEIVARPSFSDDGRVVATVAIVAR